PALQAGPGGLPVGGGYSRSETGRRDDGRGAPRRLARRERRRAADGVRYEAARIRADREARPEGRRISRPFGDGFQRPRRPARRLDDFRLQTSDFRLRTSNFYSCRSVTAGSTRVARHAGSAHATSAADASTAAVTTNVTGSVGFTANSSVPRKRVRTAAAARPIATPAAVISSAPPRTSRTTSRVRAPSATRIPNSRARWPTEKASTPKMPTAASISASTANTPTSSARNRGCDVDSAATSSIVRTRVSGWSLSTRAIAAFTAGRNDIGS